MAEFEEQFNIALIPEPHRPKQHPPLPNVLPDVWWLHSVRTDLQTIGRTKVGMALLNAIKWHGVVVSIQPMQPGSCGDGTWPIDNDIPTGNPQLTVTMGPTIWYSPEQHDLNHKCEARYKVFGQIHIEGFQVLLHELVHAFRLASFRFKASPAGKGFAFYDTTEEINAVLIQGIFASERGTPIRSSHTRHFPIDENLDTSFEFFRTGTESFDHVKKFCTENPGFTKAVAEVRTRFNPIRAYYCDPVRAQRMARSQHARDRDSFQPFFKDAYRFLWKEFRKAGLAGP